MRHFVLLSLICFSFTVNTSAEECGMLRVSGSVGWNPLVMKNSETNEITGISYDLSMEIGKRLNLPVKFIELPWKRMLAFLEHGELDIVLGIYWTKERSQKFYYTSPLFDNEARVFVLKDKRFPFGKLEDLIGKEGDIPLGGSFGDRFDKFSKEHLKLTGIVKKEARVQRLLKGRSDFFISDYLDAMWLLREQGLTDKIIALPKAVSKTQVYFAISRRSPCLHIAPEVTNLIEIFKNDGTIASVISKYADSETNVIE